MNRHHHIVLAQFLLLGCVCPNVSDAGTIELRTQTRSGNQIIEKTLTVNPDKVGIVVIDLWDYHWCMTATHRIESLVPRTNASLAAARKLGMTVFWAPTDEVLPYVGTPQRERAAAVRYHAVPRHIRSLLINDELRYYQYYKDKGMDPSRWEQEMQSLRDSLAASRQKDSPATPKFQLDINIPGSNPCACGPGIGCLCNYGMDAQGSDLFVAAEDYFVSGTTEMYSLYKEKELELLIFIGCHTNICLIGKPPSLKFMYECGANCITVRDLTDALSRYVPNGFHGDDATAQCVADIERAGVPTISFADEMKRLGVWDEDDQLVEPVRFAPWGKRHYPYLFGDSVTVTLTAPWLRGVTFHYTTDGSEPTPGSPHYTGPLVLSETTDLRAIGFHDGKQASLESRGYYARLGTTPPSPDVSLTNCRRILTVPPRYTWLPEINKSYEGYALTMRRQEYPHGIGCRAPTQLLYEIEPKYDRFVAIAGVDDGFIWRAQDPKPGVLARREARYPSVVFKVFIDGRLMAESPTMRVSTAPWNFDVQIPEGSRRLSLTLNSTGSRHPRDCGNWVNAGFVLRK